MNWLDVSESIALPLLGAVVLWAIWKFDGLAFIYDIRLTEVGIKFVLFSIFRVGFVPFSNIESVHQVNGGYFYLRVCNFKNRFGHPTFLIKKRKGIFTKQVLVTPENADEFAGALTRAGVQVIGGKKRGTS